MDDATRAIREMYEQYPYPAGQPVLRVGSDVELVLSYGRTPPPRNRPRTVLDAGCGRGLGVLGAATVQPSVRFTGVDLCRRSLDEAVAAATERGLGNVEFQECDLMTLEGLTSPPDGFDVIHSSGVLHHLSDPAAGLQRLAGVLAPHGVINLMLYGREGRRPLLKAAEAVSLLFPDGLPPLPERVGPARAVAACGREHLFAGTRFADTADVDDVELVDRLLNPNEATFGIPGLWALLEQANLRFLRWVEPADWDTDTLIADADLRRRLSLLPVVDRYRFLELLLRPPGLELIVGHAANAPREPLETAQIETTTFQLNPELIIGTRVRQTPSGTRTESLSVTVRVREPLQIGAGPVATALMQVKDKTEKLPGRRLLADLRRAGLSEADARAVVIEFLRAEILYRPH